jgi:uncharacterized LabA/DUF88 family protein
MLPMRENDDHLAVFIDVDNAFPRFNNESLRLLFDRLAGIGTVQMCRAYADWAELGNKIRETMRWAITPVHLYNRGIRRKNAADIAIAVDAMEALQLGPELSAFVLVTGDVDLAPLAARLRERGKTVLGFGRHDSSSEFLQRACNRFEFLEDLGPEVVRPKAHRKRSRRRSADGRSTDLDGVREAITQLVGDLAAIEHGHAHAGNLKERLVEQLPDFRERDYGARTFVSFLEAQADSIGVVVERTSTGGVRVYPESPRSDPVSPLTDLENDGDVADPESARDLLVRAIVAIDPDQELDLGHLKSTMRRMSPSFNERQLGYGNFLEFVRAQPDLVETLETSPNHWSVRAATG